MRASSMIERLLEDEVVHEQVTTAAGRVRDAARRARRLPPREAVQDKKVYESLRRAAGASAVAFRRLRGRDKPPPRRLGRRVVLALAAGAAAAAAANRGTRTT